MQTENKSNKISFSTTINAPKEKVWDILWGDETYKAWTSVFSEGSSAISDWNEGSKIQFLDGKGRGMYSVIEKKVPNEFMSFKHIGEVKDGVELPVDEKAQAWSGGTENYTLTEKDGATELFVEMDMVEEMKEYFDKTFPKALEEVKKLSEARDAITIEATINAPVDKVWQYWNEPEHIKQWCSASPDWHVPNATNDLKVGGNFSTRMEAKDGSFGFDFGGMYDDVKTNELIAYTMSDGRKISINFSTDGNTTKVVETFDPESQNPVEMQRAGWQAILDNFKKHTEEN